MGHPTRPSRASTAPAPTSWSGGKAAWLAVAADGPRPAIFADLPPPMDADIPEDLLPSVLRGAAASDLPPPEAIAALEHPL